MKFKRAVALISMVASISAVQSANAQGTGPGAGGCVVEQAAQAALDRQIRSIEAAQTDVSSFFQGENSCINGNLLNIIDFSRFIPDPAGMVGSIGQDAVNKLLDQAVRKACDVANDQIRQATGSINTELVSWDTGLSDEIRGIISDGQIRLQ